MDYYHLLKNLPPNFDLVIPFLKFEKELEKELLLNEKKILFQNKKIILTDSLIEKPVWAQDWWPNTESIAIDKKSHILKILKSEKNKGVYFDSTQSAMATNIRNELQELKLKRIKFEVPSKFNFQYFTWTLLDNKFLLLCKKPFSQFPLGWNEFDENKTVPPNRAYLKLWEVLTLGYIQLKPTDVVIDVGSSPGGWTWVLSEQVKKVYSVDKAPLHPHVLKNKNVFYKSADAFNLNQEEYKDCNWLFSDIICTPQKLLGLVNNWQNNSNVKNFVCTIKFKGDCDFAIIEKFKEIQNSKIIHLYQNKNEVTWIHQRLK